MASQAYLGFGPDTYAEARNRGYRLCRCPETKAFHRAQSDIDAEGAA